MNPQQSPAPLQQATARQTHMVHIVHYVWGFHTGGLENGVVNLINRLPAAQYRHSIICQTDYDPAFFARITHPNTAIYQLNKQQGHDVGLHLRLWQLLRQLNADVFHTRNLSTMEGQLIAALLGVPLRIHGEHGWDITDLGGHNTKYQRLRRWLKPLVHQFVALSSEAEDYLVQKIHVPVAKVHRICNGVDLQRFAKQSAELTADAGSKQTPLVFGTVGRLAKVKNQQLLIQAFALLWQRFPEQRAGLQLLLVGDGSERTALEQQVAAAGLTSAVTFAGNRSDVPSLMAQMQVFVLPSLAEGISNTILEAMAAGLPVLASRVGGNPELLPPEHQQSHLFTSNDAEQLAEAMAMYLQQPARLASDSALVKKHCQNHFSLDTMVNKYHQLYQAPSNKEHR